MIKICYQEGKRATPTWLLSVDIAGVEEEEPSSSANESHIAG